MTSPDRILILGGTHEAANLAEKLNKIFQDRLEIIYSLAGRIKPIRKTTIAVRIGGFGGCSGLISFIISEKIKFIIDATHPFAEKISRNAYDASVATEVPRLTLIKPCWDLPASAKFIEVNDMRHAANTLEKFSKRVLVTTGKSDLDCLNKLTSIHFFIRVFEKTKNEKNTKNFTFFTGCPPFEIDQEQALLEEHNIDTLLTKHSGGTQTISKIIAAFRKKIPIVIIRRPLPEPGEIANNIEEAIIWLKRKL